MSKISINKNIFDKQILITAIEEYKYIATITVEETSDYFNLQFDNCEYDEEETAKEFENYLIDLTNS